VFGRLGRPQGDQARFKAVSLTVGNPLRLVAKGGIGDKCTLSSEIHIERYQSFLVAKRRVMFGHTVVKRATVLGDAGIPAAHSQLVACRQDVKVKADIGALTVGVATDKSQFPNCSLSDNNSETTDLLLGDAGYSALWNRLVEGGARGRFPGARFSVQRM
jgi:hypothetical protein